VEIEKKFKGKVPLTVCRLTGTGKATLSAYSQRMLGLLKSDGSPG
jgi:ATP-dependent phosphoenolpyruvate carboxykinase